MSPVSPATAIATLPAGLQWDVFCRVIDNHGDLGVAWRLCSQLAQRGQRVRLWVDDPSALGWMAPGAVQGQVPGVRIIPWRQTTGDDGNEMTAQPEGITRSDIWVETFGCDIDPHFIATQRHFTLDSIQKGIKNPVWINLEYLSAEPYVERCHGLPSPVMQGPARGMTRHFFYPGFTERTGGLLRGPESPIQAAKSERLEWLALRGVQAREGEQLVSLFCYEPLALPALLAHWRKCAPATRLLVTHGRATAAVQAVLDTAEETDGDSQGSLSISYLPALSQTDYDGLLARCDLNFVRGEDSLVRALWAGKPFVWQIYPQHDGAHEAKLMAFLDWLRAPASLRGFHRAWNALDDTATGAFDAADLLLTEIDAWQVSAQQARIQLLALPDLVTTLFDFIAERR